MVTYTSPNNTWDAGVPSQEAHDFAVTLEGLITGETPAQFVQDIATAFSQTLTAGMVVGLNASGDVVQATWNAVPSSAIKPVGVLMYSVTTGASGNKLVSRVLRAGCINPDRLTWHSTFDTAAKRMAAFEGSASPTQIVLRGLSHFTPVAP